MQFSAFGKARGEPPPPPPKFRPFPQGGLPFYLESERQKLLQALRHEEHQQQQPTRPQPRRFLGRLRKIRQNQAAMEPVLKTIASMPPPPTPKFSEAQNQVVFTSNAAQSPTINENAELQERLTQVPNVETMGNLANAANTNEKTKDPKEAAVEQASSTSPPLKIIPPPPLAPKNKDNAIQKEKEKSEASPKDNGEVVAQGVEEKNNTNDSKSGFTEGVEVSKVHKDTETLAVMTTSPAKEVMTDSVPGSSPPLPPRESENKSPEPPQSRRNSPITKIAKVFGVEGDSKGELETTNPLSASDEPGSTMNVDQGMGKTFSSIAVTLLRELESFHRDKNLKKPNVESDGQIEVEATPKQTEKIGGNKLNEKSKAPPRRTSILGKAVTQVRTKALRKGRKITANKTTTARRVQKKPPQPKLYGDWRAAIDAASGDDYYYNLTTREVAWELPPNPNEAAKAKMEAVKRPEIRKVVQKSGMVRSKTTPGAPKGKLAGSASAPIRRKAQHPAMKKSTTASSAPPTSAGVRKKQVAPKDDYEKTRIGTPKFTGAKGNGNKKQVGVKNTPAAKQTGGGKANTATTPATGGKGVAPTKVTRVKGNNTTTAKKATTAANESTIKKNGVAKVNAASRNNATETQRLRPTLKKADPGAGWHSTRDLETGDEYYFNTLTKEVTWDKPTGVSGPIPRVRPI